MAPTTLKTRTTSLLVCAAAGLIAAHGFHAVGSDEPHASPAATPTNSVAKPQPFGAPQPQLPSNAPTKPAERLREGTRLTDVQGSFVSIGADSVTFSPKDSKDSYRVLENLALQRIALQLDENRGQRQWIVSGTITEFRGANYLLVSKAVVRLQEGDTATGR